MALEPVPVPFGVSSNPSMGTEPRLRDEERSVALPFGRRSGGGTAVWCRFLVSLR